MARYYEVNKMQLSDGNMKCCLVLFLCFMIHHLNHSYLSASTGLSLEAR